MSKVYGVWYMTGLGADELLGLYSTESRARVARLQIIEDDEDVDLFYITKMSVDNEDEWQSDVKGEVVDEAA